MLEVIKKSPDKLTIEDFMIIDKYISDKVTTPLTDGVKSLEDIKASNERISVEIEELSKKVDAQIELSRLNEERYQRIEQQAPATVATAKNYSIVIGYLALIGVLAFGTYKFTKWIANSVLGGGRL